MRIYTKIMTFSGLPFLLLLLLAIGVEQGHADNQVQDDGSAFECIFEENPLGCLRIRLGRELDKIEVQAAGKDVDTPVSKVIEETGNLVAQVVSGDFEALQDSQEVEEKDESRGLGEARKKKFGKKKGLQKVIALAMLLKAKLSLLLQAVSTHLQVKFFVIAIISLVINASRFWLDLKKGHQPQKVIYYEHAQHQHHYEHDDHDHGYWGRSADSGPDDIAYRAYKN